MTLRVDGNRPMAAWANRILLVSIIAYGLVSLGKLYIDAPWYEGLYWCVQSACIGSVADWFAVTALFRKPLGFPYHTALLPKKKDKLIGLVVQLVEDRLLSKDRCETMLRQVQFVPWISRFLASESSKQEREALYATILQVAWASRSQEEWASWGEEKIVELLDKQSLVGPVEGLLLRVCRDNAYENVVIRILKALEEALNSEMAFRWLQATIDEEIEKRKDQGGLQSLILSITEATNIVNSTDMALAVIEELVNLLRRWQEPGSRERRDIMAQWGETIATLGKEGDMRITIEAIWRQWIHEQDWKQLLLRHFCPLIEDMIRLEEGSYRLPQVIDESLCILWEQYVSTPERVVAVEGRFHAFALYVLEHGHSLIGKTIRGVLEGFSMETFVAFVEGKIGEDLSWIRINGAMVGAVLGIVVWLVLTYVYEPLLVAAHIL